MIERNENGDKTKKQKFSYSKLNQYENCPYAYNLKYNEGHYANEPNLAAFYGVTVHKILEIELTLIKNGRPINYDLLKTDFQKYNIPKRNPYDRDGDIFGTEILKKKFPRDWYEFGKDEKNYDIKAEEFLERGIYRFPEYMEQHPELEIVGAEVGFQFEYRGYTFTGFIDRLLKERGKDRYLIFDIKTKGKRFPDKELTTPLQFVCYAKAVRDMYGDDVEIECYYDLPTVDAIQPAGTKGFEARGWKKIDKLLDGIEAGDWRPRSGRLCAWCSYRPHEGQPENVKNLCPYFNLSTKTEVSYDVEFEWEGPDKHDEVMKKFLERVRLEEGESKKRLDIQNFDFDF